jgi:chemotaxis methyl-accepting protein methylase
VVPRDLNVVVERLEPLPDNQRFDLVVATNILVYYDAFEQALALGNISSMLRPGGFLITSDVVSPVAPMDTTAARTTTVERDRQGTRDVLFAYERH